MKSLHNQAGMPLEKNIPLCQEGLKRRCEIQPNAILIFLLPCFRCIIIVLMLKVNARLMKVQNKKVLCK